ncbi:MULTISPECIES: hypothetical protein [unclassified Halomonas]|uniref:hypothetical protein n=1 Tax=unclassified Halomonas TaxID=2609666 RepID=UPI0020A1AA67|nr:MULTISPECIES: hypothetical protein [unclassified Halomonas]MCP1313707.1 hypothetical protein [Halomonas sp. 707D7]MCP1326873.1 hypothetical protein [Halomonas sp. 707D4]
MESKYKIRLLRVNLLLAAAVLVLWSFGAPPLATVALWTAALWLFTTAVLLEFTLRHSRDLSWQVLTSALLLFLIAAAPERHSILIWVWAALFMLSQHRIMTLFNIGGALSSWLLVAFNLSAAQAAMLLVALVILTLLAIAQTRRLIDLNGSIRQRLRLIPGLNLWAGEQLLKDLNREQIRARREDIYAEVLIVHQKRHQLWAHAQRLCELTHDFENVYRLDGSTLAVLLLCRDAATGAQRRLALCSALSSGVVHQHVPLEELDPAGVSLECLSRRHDVSQRSGA